MHILWPLQAHKLKIGTKTDAAPSNDYYIIYFKSFEHSKVAQEQKVTKFCVYSVVRLTGVPAVIYIPAVGHVTVTLRHQCL